VGKKLKKLAARLQLPRCLHKEISGTTCQFISTVPQLTRFPSSWKWKSRRFRNLFFPLWSKWGGEDKMGSGLDRDARGNAPKFTFSHFFRVFHFMLLGNERFPARVVKWGRDGKKAERKSGKA
jgi:hypothetical protein